MRVILLTFILVAQLAVHQSYALPTPAAISVRRDDGSTTSETYSYTLHRRAGLFAAKELPKLDNGRVYAADKHEALASANANNAAKEVQAGVVGARKSVTMGASQGYLHSKAAFTSFRKGQFGKGFAHTGKAIVKPIAGVGMSVVPLFSGLRYGTTNGAKAVSHKFQQWTTPRGKITHTNQAALDYQVWLKKNNIKARVGSQAFIENNLKFNTQNYAKVPKVIPPQPNAYTDRRGDLTSGEQAGGKASTTATTATTIPQTNPTRDTRPVMAQNEFSGVPVSPQPATPDPAPARVPVSTASFDPQAIPSRPTPQDSRVRLSPNELSVGVNTQPQHQYQRFSSLEKGKGIAVQTPASTSGTAGDYSNSNLAPPSSNTTLDAIALPLYRPASDHEIVAFHEPTESESSIADPPFPIGIKDKHRMLAKASSIRAAKELGHGVHQAYKTVVFGSKQGHLHSKEAIRRLRNGEKRKGIQQMGQAIAKTIGGVGLSTVPLINGAIVGIKGGANALSHKIQQHKAGKYQNSTNEREQVLKKAKEKKKNLRGRDWSRDFTRKCLQYQDDGHIDKFRPTSSRSVSEVTSRSAESPGKASSISGSTQSSSSKLWYSNPLARSYF